MLASQIDETITNFAEAFNANDLDRVMSFFADEAVYEPGDGKVHHGKAQIREAFAPQFDAALGTMRFDERDRIIDVENRKAAFRWICRHDIARAKPHGLLRFLQKVVLRVWLGTRFGWQGVDIFHFDADGRIRGKFSYGWYGSLPHLERAFG